MPTNIAAAIKNLMISGSILSPTPNNTADTENINKLFTFLNITILSSWKSSFTIANQVVNLITAGPAGSVPNFLLALVDNPIRLDFSTGAGDIMIATPIINAALITVPPTTTPVSWALSLDGTIAANTNCPAVLQGSIVNYQIFACQAAVS